MELLATSLTRQHHTPLMMQIGLGTTRKTSPSTWLILSATLLRIRKIVMIQAKPQLNFVS